ncbi:MAG TPA: hypothetical protein VJB11_01350 [archaeon]|nr:hypothetical protein [archaeon]
MPTAIFGQYVGFWFGTLTSISFLLIFLTCRIWGATRLPKIFGKYWESVHKWAWIFGIISVLLHFASITSGYVFGLWW